METKKRLDPILPIFDTKKPYFQKKRSLNLINVHVSQRATNIFVNKLTICAVFHIFGIREHEN